MNFQIAIDGPSGTGKSTVAKILAEKLGFLYIDTGAMYRSVAYYFVSKNLDFKDNVTVISELDNINLKLTHENGRQEIYVNQENCTNLIRTQEVAEATSKYISQIPEVRIRLVKMQQEMANGNNVILDGRDIGSKVLPNAQLKLFLNSSLEVKTNRRCNELKLLGLEFSKEKVREEIKIRDFRDSNRPLDPLVKTDDAIYIDTSSLSIEEVVNKILHLVCVNKK